MVPTVDDAGKVATLVRADAVAFIAGLFVLGFIALLVWHLKTLRAHAGEVQTLNTDRLRLVEDHTRQLVAILSAQRPRARQRRPEAPDAPEATEP